MGYNTAPLQPFVLRIVTYLGVIGCSSKQVPNPSSHPLAAALVVFDSVVPVQMKHFSNDGDIDCVWSTYCGEHIP